MITMEDADQGKRGQTPSNSILQRVKLHYSISKLHELHASDLGNSKTPFDSISTALQTPWVRPTLKGWPMEYRREDEGRFKITCGVDCVLPLWKLSDRLTYDGP